MHSKTGRPAKTPAALAALALIMLSAIVVGGCSEATPANTWVKPNQNAFNTRYTGGRISTSTIANLAVGWTANQRTKAGFGSQAPSPFISERNVFVQAPAGNLVAFNLQSGELSAGVQSPRIATLMPSWLLRRGNGRLRDLASSISPLLTQGKDEKAIAVGAAGENVTALNASDGSQAWTRKISGRSGTRARVISNMAAAHGTIYVPVANVPTDVTSENIQSVVDELTKSDKNNGQLVAINAENGKVSWTKKLASVPLGAATVVNDVVFTSTLDGNVYGFNASNGDQVWTSKLPAGAVAPIAAYSGTLIVPAGLVTKKGQRAQVVAFTIGGLGSIGGAAAPKVKAQAEEKVAGKAEGAGAAEPEATGPDGKALFAQNCGGCHKLADAGTSGASGPDLDALKPSEAVTLKQVTNGGAAMPAFKATLSAEEIKAISAYVASVAGK